MAQVKVTELPTIQLDEFSPNDSFLIIDDGKVRILKREVFYEWLKDNIQGEKGEQGVAGRDGARGRDGVDGSDGSDGRSAYQLAVMNGFTGSVSQWLKSLAGSQGAAGDDGDDGWSPVFRTEDVNGGSYLEVVDWVGGSGEKPVETGYVSPEGLVGDVAIASNLKGEKGDRGLQGERGLRGLKGDTGEQGIVGATGSSAYEVAVKAGFVGTEEEWLASLNPATVSEEEGNIITKKIDGMYAPATDPLEMANGIDALEDKNIMTDAQKSKLESLKSSMYLGTFLSPEGIPLEGAVAGNYADVDSGEEGVDTERWIFDENDNKFVKSISLPASETSESVKEKYESNPNTNAFTDSLLSKLESLPTEGVQGEKGAQGEKGEKGDSAYEVAVSEGFTGTVNEWLNSLKGEKGDAGESSSPSDFGSGYLDSYQSSKNSKDFSPYQPPEIQTPPNSAETGGVNSLTETAFTSNILGQDGWMILTILDCDTPDWSLSRNGEVIATWNYTHPDVSVRVWDGSTTNTSPVREDFVNAEITVQIGDSSGETSFSLISNCDEFLYKHEGVNSPFATVNFSKISDVKNFRIDAPKAVVTMPTTLPSTVRSLQNAFQNSDIFNDPNIVNWDVSNVNNFIGMFRDSRSFNQPIGGWDMSNARSIDEMFKNATNFEADISGWNTKNVVSMSGFFGGDTSSTKPPSQDLSQWCVPLLGEYEGRSVTETLGLQESHMPVWGTCPRGENQ